MRSYRFPLLCAFIFCFLLITGAYYYDLEGKYTHLADLQQGEKETRQKWLALQQSHSSNQIQVSKFPVVTNSAFNGMSRLANFAHINGLSIQSIKQTLKINGERMIHLIALGQFAQIKLFLSALEKNGEIKYFSCRLMKYNLLQMEADIFMRPFSNQSLSIIDYNRGSPHHSNPFCFNLDINTWSDYVNHSLLQAISIKLMKMVGYLRQGERIQALILLPNTNLVAIRKGIVLGKERATVLSIQPDRVQVSLQNKTTQYLMMAS